jgi:hypothetical protein
MKYCDCGLRLPERLPELPNGRQEFIRAGIIDFGLESAI